jgi:hypothetical protein
MINELHTYQGGGQPKRTENYKSYPEYYKFYKDRGTANPVTKQQFNSIVRKFNLLIREQIVENGYGWQTFGIATQIRIVKYRRKIKEVAPGRFNLPIDRLATYKLRQEIPNAPPVYHFNEHSDNMTCRVEWKRPLHPYLIKYYTFVRCARFKKHVTEAVVQRSAHDNYFEFVKYTD